MPSPAQLGEIHEIRHGAADVARPTRRFPAQSKRLRDDEEKRLVKNVAERVPVPRRWETSEQKREAFKEIPGAGLALKVPISRCPRIPAFRKRRAKVGKPNGKGRNGRSGARDSRARSTEAAGNALWASANEVVPAQRRESGPNDSDAHVSITTSTPR